MARNRARTWTALERRVMWYRRSPNFIRRMMICHITGVMPSHDELMAHAERIILTKGHCVQMTANRIVSQPDEDFGARRDPITGWSYEEIYPALVRDWQFRTRRYGKRWRTKRVRSNFKHRNCGRIWRGIKRKAEKLDNAARNASNEQKG